VMAAGHPRPSSRRQDPLPDTKPLDAARTALNPGANLDPKKQGEVWRGRLAHSNMEKAPEQLTSLL
jgi:hypothetical protein